MVYTPATRIVDGNRTLAADINPIIDNQADFDTRITTNANSAASNKATADSAAAGVATNTTNIATNTTNIATNTTNIADLQTSAPSGLTADFLITSWQQYDLADGTPADDVRWEYHNASNLGTLGTPSDRVVDTISRTINRVAWYQSGIIRIWGNDNTEAAWGTDFSGNTALSLYVYTVGFPTSLTPSDNATLTEYELASGTTATWGAGATYVQYSAAIPRGFTDQVDVRFLIANKGEIHDVAIYLGIKHPQIDTNTAAIAANTAAIASLPDFDVENIVADFTITNWVSQGSGNSRSFRWNSAPSAMGTIAAGGDVAFTPDAREISFGRIEWYPDDASSSNSDPELRIYGTSDTDAAWGTEVNGNTELSLYAYLQGSTNSALLVNELPFSDGNTFNWGTGNAATGVSWENADRAMTAWGITTGATAIRFIVADKGQGARIAVWLGVAHGIPELEPYALGLDSSAFINATRDIWYDSGIAIPASDDAAQQYEFLVTSGAARPAARIQAASKVLSKRAIGATVRLPSGVVSGTTTFDNTTHSALYLPVNDLPAGFYICRANTGDNLWLAAIQLNDSPARVRFVVYRVGDRVQVP